MSVIEDSKKTGKEADSFIDAFPELFPCGIENGYLMKEIRRPKKSGIPIRRIGAEGIS